MLSAGMLDALAAATAARSRGLASASPPPSRADMVISRMILVKILPRLASALPFLCLIVLHLLWPDIIRLPPRRTAAALGAGVLYPVARGVECGGTRSRG